MSLAQKVFEKHLADGDSSLLHNLDGMDWKATGAKITECLRKHQEAEDCKRKMEEAYRERDLTLPEIQEILRASKSLLKASFTKNPKKMGEWGFTAKRLKNRVLAGFLFVFLLSNLLKRCAW